MALVGLVSHSSRICCLLSERYLHLAKPCSHHSFNRLPNFLSLFHITVDIWGLVHSKRWFLTLQQDRDGPSAAPRCHHGEFSLLPAGEQVQNNPG